MNKLPLSKLDVELIALDLDDTLLNSNREISDKNVQVLQECANRGIYVVLCSGRAEDGILPYVRRLDIAGLQAGRFIIAINGCSIFDMHERKQIYTCNVDSKVLLYANTEAKKMGLYSEVYSPDTIYYEKQTDWTRKDVDMCGLKGVIVDDYTSFLQNKGFPKMLIPGEPETLLVLQKKLKEELKDKAVIFTSKPYFLEILPPNCGKGESIQWLADYIGIPKNTTMGFGDSMNDESMIVKCGYGISMINGIDYIKNCADFITEQDNDNSGVGNFIEKFVL